MTIWKKFKALLSGIELNHKVPRHPAHLWYALLSFLSISTALVMHGHVHYTIAVTALVLPLSLLAYVPYRYCNILSRMLLNCCIFGAGCFWISLRLKQDVPTDKLLVEALALWSLTFLTAGKSKGYFYLLFIDILLLLYGALLPRLLSLYLTIAAFAVILIILFRNRTGFLSGDMLLATPRRTFRRTWHFCLIWLIITGLAFHFVFGLIPLTDNTIEGLIPVSFSTGRESFATPKLQEWLNSGRNQKNGPKGQKINDEVPGENTTLSKREKGKSITLPQPPPNAPMIPGDGGSSMGKDLLFQVKSPLKLYHLARLYDHYDGLNWRVSPHLRRNTLKSGRDLQGQQIKLSYSVEKLFSASLAIPWQYSEFVPDDTVRSTLTFSSHFWGVQLNNPPSVFPFKFTARSTLPAITPDKGGKPAPISWPERSGRQIYLNLPREKISLRVKQLALSLTENHTTPYAKAMALRNFLRSNYTYKLHASPTPRHRESVDYFLFYLGEGHCEYFASALAVLARCAGLPSRVATGFSPGNYNTLTSLFEVYEYHAHAWTQIYIPEFGWLTFDATPPSSIVSETYPPGLGKMRDPFGEEWRIRPPELTDNTLEYIQKLRISEERKKQNGGNIEQTLDELASAGDKLREELKQGDIKEAEKAPGKAPQGKLDLTRVRVHVMVLFRKFQTSLIDFTLYIVSSWTRLLLAVALLLLTVLLSMGLVILLRWWFKLIKLQVIYRRSRDFRRPVRAIRNSCRGALLLLEIKGMPRHGNEELLEYAGLLRSDIAAELIPIVRVFYRSEYRSGPPSEQDAGEAAAHLESLCTLLKKRGR